MAREPGGTVEGTAGGSPWGTALGATDGPALGATDGPVLGAADGAALRPDLRSAMRGSGARTRGAAVVAARRAGVLP